MTPWLQHCGIRYTNPVYSDSITRDRERNRDRDIDIDRQRERGRQTDGESLSGSRFDSR